MRYAICLLFASIVPGALSMPIVSAVATVKDVDTVAGTAAVQTTNNSKKDITGYVITAVATYASGKTENDEHSRDYGPRTTYEVFGLLRPGMSSEDTIHFTVRDNDPLRLVDAKVVVVIYSDQTAEVADPRAFENQMKTRRSAANSLQRSLDILRTALKDTADAHPSGKAVELVKEAVFSARANDQETNTGFLLEMQRDMEQAKGRAGIANVSEREFLQQYLAEKEKKAASFAEYINVRSEQ